MNSMNRVACLFGLCLSATLAGAQPHPEKTIAEGYAAEAGAPAVGTCVPAVPAAGITLASTRPLADAQTERHGMSVFITAYQNWKDEQERRFCMGRFSQAQEYALIAYVERGECAVFNGFLFGVGWHHIPSYEQYTDEEVLEYGKTIDALVEICETIK